MSRLQDTHTQAHTPCTHTQTTRTHARTHASTAEGRGKTQDFLKRVFWGLVFSGALAAADALQEEGMGPIRGVEEGEGRSPKSESAREVEERMGLGHGMVVGVEGAGAQRREREVLVS